MALAASSDFWDFAPKAGVKEWGLRGKPHRTNSAYPTRLSSRSDQI